MVYGGGGVGLMGLVANAALKAGGKVVGVIPRFLLQREAGHPALTETVVVETMHERKLAMFERSDAFVVLPGGIGTLEELFEVLSWRTLGLHTKPIVIVDQGGYWRPLAALLRSVVEGGFAERTPPRPCRLRARPQGDPAGDRRHAARSRPRTEAGPRLTPRRCRAAVHCLPRGDATRQAIISNRSTQPNESGARRCKYVGRSVG